MSDNEMLSDRITTPVVEHNNAQLYLKALFRRPPHKLKSGDYCKVIDRIDMAYLVEMPDGRTATIFPQFMWQPVYLIDGVEVPAI